eukprot:m.233295 g.233295  ORF g.233295 m.233295 type:complete len:120 (+) comp15729_c0_seq8:243-602(+)
MLANHTVGLLRYAKQVGRPFFIGAGFRRPHTPWYINKRFVDMYDSVPIKPPKYPDWAQAQPPCAFICGGDGVGCDFTINQPRPTNETVLCRKTCRPTSPSDSWQHHFADHVALPQTMPL